MADTWQEESERFAVHSDDVRESFKLAFDSVKHLMTLSGVVLAVFATFLESIFPHELNIEAKVLIALAFALFTLSLVFSAFSMWRIAGLVRSRREYSKKKKKLRWNLLLPSFCFILGLNLFGTAVLLNVFFGAGDYGEQGAIGRFILYPVQGLTILIVAAWVWHRVRRGNKRDTEGKYEVMYPFVRDYDELVAREMPEKAFLTIQRSEDDLEQSYDHNKLASVHKGQHGNGRARREMSNSPQQIAPTEAIKERREVYAELLSLTHPHKLAVIGSHVSIDYFDFRDAADKLEAQILLMSQPGVGELANKIVNSFIDCVVAKERQLSQKRKVDELKYNDKDKQAAEDKELSNLQTQFNHKAAEDERLSDLQTKLSDKARQAAEDEELDEKLYEKLDKRLDEMLDEVVEELHTKLNKWQRTMVKRRTKLKLRKTDYEEKYNDLRKARDEFVDTTRKDLDRVIKSEARHGIGN